MNKQILQKSDIAELTGRHVKTIERWIREGFFPGGRYMKGRQVWTEKSFPIGFQNFRKGCKAKTVSAHACMTGRLNSNKSLRWYA